MAVTTTDAATVAASAKAQVAASTSKMAANSQTFLTLLTTQLKNQDPTAPTDMNSMTQQLTQMTGVEQQLLSNELLTKLVSQSANAMGTAVGLIGKTVTVAGGNLYRLAADAYGDATLWYVIAAANGLWDPMLSPVPTALIVPPKPADGGNGGIRA